MEHFPSRESGREDKESCEYEATPEAISSLLDAPPDLLATFQDRLAGAAGHLRIAVHPLFTEQRPKSTRGKLGSESLESVQAQLREAFLKTIESVAHNQQSSPLIVYEAKDEIATTKELIAAHLQCETEELGDLGILFLPTESFSSAFALDTFIAALDTGHEADEELATTLKRHKATIDRYEATKHKYQAEFQRIPGYNKGRLEDTDEESRQRYTTLMDRYTMELESQQPDVSSAWNEIYKLDNQFTTSLYQKLGLQSALVSGTYVETKRDGATNEMTFDACAGAVIRTLRAAGFPTDISKHIWPPKETIVDAGLSVKQTGRGSDSNTFASSN